MLLVPGCLFLAFFVSAAKGSNSSQNTTTSQTSTGAFFSYNKLNSYAVYEAQWNGPGELSMLFNTRKPTAFLAYQDDGTYNHFDLFLIKGKVRARVTFDSCQWEQLTIDGNFSDSRWHRVRLERSLANVTLTVDGCNTQSIQCKYTASEEENWQTLYVGSIPWESSMRQSLAKPGIFGETLASVFQGCIGHVTQTAVGESPRPLALRSTAWTGPDCGDHCVSGGKCAPIDEVTRKKCECLENIKEELNCKLLSSQSDTDLGHKIKASSSLTSQSAHMTSFSERTPVLSSSSQSNVKATSTKTTDSSTPTRTQAASKHAQDSFGLQAQFVDVEHLHQSSSVPGNASHAQHLSSVPAPTRSSALVALFSSSINTPLQASVGNNGSVLAIKNSSWRILGSFVPVYLAGTAVILNNLLSQ